VIESANLLSTDGARSSECGPAHDGSATATDSVAAGTCRFCRSPLRHTFVDLGMSPLCESFLSRDQLNEMEPFYPLHAHVCERCFLVQLNEYVTPDNIFSDYAYFSSYSDSWLRHAEKYVAQMIDRFQLGCDNRVVEIASNDGYLLQYFVARGVPALGIDPAANVVRAAAEKGVRTLVAFFGADTARRVVVDEGRADLVVANNVLAHVPDLNDFVAGIRLLLAPGGVVTFEFPHLLQLIDGNQFDTIYHEHFCYFSFTTVVQVLAAHGLEVFDVEELSTHGGSLRVFARHEEVDEPVVGRRVKVLLERESDAGYTKLITYRSFREQVEYTKFCLLEFLIQARRDGKTVAGYGAPGKGNTLLNYCGIREDLLDYTVDRNPHKHGKFLPGTHIPIFAPDRIAETKPDYVLILPWNLKDELLEQLAYVREWGGRLVLPIPEVVVYP